MNIESAHEQNIEFLKKICSEAGIKLTHQRLEIFQEMMLSDDHPSADVLYERLKKRNPTIAIDTVYRTLATFDKLGMIKKVHVMGERTLFDKNLDQHHHFVCTRCKAVQDIYWPEFDTTSPPTEASQIGRVTSRHIEIRGVCNNCIKDEESD